MGCIKKYFVTLLMTTLLLPVMHSPVLAYEPVEIESSPGNVTFSHKSHNGIDCLECHHETSSVNRIAPCRQCHKKQSVGNMASEHAFHKNCIDCHARLKQQKKPTGPVKLCSQCHIRKRP